MKYEELDPVAKTIAVLTKSGIETKYDHFYENGVFDKDATMKAFEEELMKSLLDKSKSRKCKGKNHE